jgi:hypothetical protein
MKVSGTIVCYLKYKMTTEVYGRKRISSDSNFGVGEEGRIRERKSDSFIIKNPFV